MLGADRMPRVSVIINVYNGEKYLRQAIDSVYAQQYTDWELILWDNASTDSTPDIAKEYDQRLKYHRGETNVVLGTARNFALDQASGELVAFLDSDDLWRPDKLAWQIELLDANPESCLVYSDAAVIDENGQVTAEHWMSRPPVSGFVFVEILKGYFINWQTVLIRKSAMDEIGGFGPYCYAEDFDVLARLALKYPMTGDARVTASYRVHKGNSSAALSTYHPEVGGVLDYLHDLLSHHEKKKEWLPQLNRMRYEFYYDRGNRLCFDGDYDAGRAQLRFAWRRCEFRWRAFLMWALTTLLPRQAFRELMNAKRKLFQPL